MYGGVAERTSARSHEVGSGASRRREIWRTLYGKLKWWLDTKHSEYLRKFDIKIVFVEYVDSLPTLHEYEYTGNAWDAGIADSHTHLVLCTNELTHVIGA